LHFLRCLRLWSPGERFSRIVLTSPCKLLI
jgi:hypothetical protein